VLSFHSFGDTPAEQGRCKGTWFGLRSVSIGDVSDAGCILAFLWAAEAKQMLLHKGRFPSAPSVVVLEADDASC